MYEYTCYELFDSLNTTRFGFISYTCIDTIFLFIHLKNTFT